MSQPVHGYLQQLHHDIEQRLEHQLWVEDMANPPEFVAWCEANAPQWTGHTASMPPGCGMSFWEATERRMEQVMDARKRGGDQDGDDFIHCPRCGKLIHRNQDACRECKLAT